MQSNPNDGLLKQWGPQIAAWVIAALLGLGVYQSRIAVLERTDVDHTKRIETLEVQSRDMQRVLSRLEVLLDHIEKRFDLEYGNTQRQGRP